MPPEATLPPELLTLGDNEIYLEELTDIIRVSGGITPFIGAGTSVSYNFPPWRTFLLDLADAEGIRDSIEPQLDAGQFEEAAGALMDTMGARFQNHFKEHFGDRVLGKRTFDGVVTILPQLTSGPIITTNFDHVLEGAFAQVACPLKPVWGHKITQAYVDGFHRNSRILYKLHGDVDEEEDRILTLGEYETHYGTTTADKVDRDKQLPKLLLLIFKTQPVLFVGCSLDKDRTVSVLMGAVRDLYDLTHYAILEQPDDPAVYAAKRNALRNQGFKVIWFPHRGFASIEPILQYLAAAVPDGMRRCIPTTTPAPAWRLPPEKTPFIGREVEVAELSAKVRAGRLVTATGTGGSGKTRIAIQTARAVRSDFPDGVAFVGFASVHDPGAVPGTIAKRLGLREQASAPPTDILAEFLASKNMLLVLDNCEHLLESCQAIVQELQERTRNLTILATSRQRLGLAGEDVMVVGALNLPEDPDETDVEVLGRSDAIALFLERAVRARRDFTLTPENAPSVHEICRELAGIPLAIELAAARLRGAVVAEIAADLANAMATLTDAPADAPERHQTLEAAIDWSYQPLTDEQKDLFGGLSVFAGGAQIDAVRKVSYENALKRRDVRDRLTELVERSLVQLDPQPEGMRFILLETLRQYGFAKLGDAGTAEEYQDRQLAWTLQGSRHADAQLNGPNEHDWLNSFETEHDNIRAAMKWAIQSRQFDKGLELGLSVRRFWEKRGYVTEGRRLLGQLLEAGSQDRAEPTYARVLSAAGILAYRQGDSEPARRLFERALAMEDQLDDPVRHAEAISDLGIAVQVQGDYQEALKLHTKARDENLKIHDNTDEPELTASSKRQATVALFNMGNAAYEMGDLDRAQEWLEQSAADFAEAENWAEESFARTALGRVAMHQRRYVVSRAELDLALEKRTRNNNKRGMGDTLTGLARLDAVEGHLEEGRAKLFDAVQLQREVDDKKGLAMSAEAAAILATALGKTKRIATYLGMAFSLRNETKVPRRPVDVDELERVERSARAKLGDQAFDVAHAMGAAMTLEEIVEYARSEVRDID